VWRLHITKEEDRGQKAHILADMQSLLLHGIVAAADVQERDGGALLTALFGLPRFSSEAVHRPRLRGADLSRRAGRHPAPSENRDPQTIRSHQGLCRAGHSPNAGDVEATSSAVCYTSVAKIRHHDSSAV
jgi:hypothetical protein